MSTQHTPGPRNAYTTRYGWLSYQSTDAMGIVHVGVNAVTDDGGATEVARLQFTEREWAVIDESRKDRVRAAIAKTTGGAA